MNGMRHKNDSPDLSVRLWVCLLLIIALVAVVVYFRGFDLWTVILVSLALACPAVIVWGMSILRRDDPSKEGPLPR